MFLLCFVLVVVSYRHAVWSRTFAPMQWRCCLRLLALYLKISTPNERRPTKRIATYYKKQLSATIPFQRKVPMIIKSDVCCHQRRSTSKVLKSSNWFVLMCCKCRKCPHYTGTAATRNRLQLSPGRPQSKKQVEISKYIGTVLLNAKRRFPTQKAKLRGVKLRAAGSLRCRMQEEVVMLTRFNPFIQVVRVK